MNTLTTTITAIAIAVIARTAAIATKLLPSRQTPNEDYVTRQECHLAMDDIRTRIATRCKDIVCRLDRIESSITRLENLAIYG